LSESKPSVDELIHAFAAADTLDALPDVVDVLHVAPPNPPEAIQAAFVGSSYVSAYAEAASFVRVADQWSGRHRGRGLATSHLIVDFGSGWGRISRFLLAHVRPSSLLALDVDVLMTALVNSTLPGVNTMTVSSFPPTMLRDGIADAFFAFSVFSHLSPRAHAAWALEFGRLSVPGAMVFLTLLDAAFFDQVQSAKDAVDGGEESAFTLALAGVLPDLRDARHRYASGEPIYAGVGGGGVRSGDYYGWAVIPPVFMERTWGEAGFDIVEWVPSGTLFAQAMVALVKRS
jgi:hypothetical protein